MLRNLQGNILKSHRRNHTVHLFLKFTGDTTKIKSWMRDFATGKVTSAHKQLKQSTGELFCNLFLTGKGYETLGFGNEISEKLSIDDKNTMMRMEFPEGMEHYANKLHDKVEDWHPKYRNRQIDAMILLAHNDKTALSSEAPSELSAVLDGLQGVADIRVCERGKVLLNDANQRIEHFGYADGISDPRFFTISNAPAGTDTPLNLVLTPDPFSPNEDSFGSFLVFRKLEQKIDDFEKAVCAFAKTLSDGTNMSPEEAKARAEAMVIGRFKDGTPLALSRQAGGPQHNNFDYTNDPLGDHCPIQAHIRRLDPRTSSEKEHRIARRGIPYGHRSAPNGAGLLFMCFQRSLTKQFGMLQAIWANSTERSNGFQSDIGVDPIIGQSNLSNIKSPNWRLNGQKHPFSFRDFVTVKGGEFFFAPSLPFLQNPERI